MVRIRLRRVGAKKQPTYRIVVTDSGSPRDGRFIEKIGFYNPRTQPATVLLDEPRALYWLSVGAQPSEAVRHMMDRAGTIGRYERMRKGEALETLVAEAQAQVAGSPAIDPRTRRDDVKPQPKKPKAQAAEAAAEAPVEAVAEPVADEAEAPMEDEVPVEEAAEPPAEGENEAPAE